MGIACLGEILERFLARKPFQNLPQAGNASQRASWTNKESKDIMEKEGENHGSSKEPVFAPKVCKL